MADNKALRNRESRTPSRGRSGGRTDTLASERQGLTGGFVDVPGRSGRVQISGLTPELVCKTCGKAQESPDDSLFKKCDKAG